MILKSKICGVSDSTTLHYIINHAYPSQFIGFIVNYPKSKRYVDLKKVKELLKISKKKSFYVAVLVNPDYKILEEIKKMNGEIMRVAAQMGSVFLLKHHWKLMILKMP